MHASSPVPSFPAVSVVLACRNEAVHIEDCLRSILGQEEPEGGFEVIVADGMSSDGTREILERIAAVSGREVPPSSRIAPQLSTLNSHLSVASGQWSVVSSPSVRLIDNPGRIVAAGLNAAIRVARGDIIVRMDAHTAYAPDYLKECVKVLKHSGADNIGGPARTKADAYLQKAVAAAYHSRFSVGGARFHNAGYEGLVDTVTYGCWRKEAFEKFGHFDEDLPRNQDDEHNLRIIRGGGKIYQSPKIRSWYRPRGSLRMLFKQYTHYGYWKVRVIQKHKLPASWRHLVPGTFVLTLMLLFLLSCIGLMTTDRGLLASISGLSSVLLLCLLAIYGLCLFGASLLTAAKTEWRLLPVLPLVFPCYHLGYGWGFLRGVWDFVIRRKGAHKSFEALTR